jgi:alpha-tubulin suppressor-like RCC1 family protein
MVLTCGSNKYHALGTGTPNNSLTFEPVPSLGKKKVISVSAGPTHSACVTEAKEVFMWGNGKKGKLGAQNENDQPVPIYIDFLEGKFVKSVSCGFDWTSVLTGSYHL